MYSMLLLWLKLLVSTERSALIDAVVMAGATMAAATMAAAIGFDVAIWLVIFGKFCAFRLGNYYISKRHVGVT